MTNNEIIQKLLAHDWLVLWERCHQGDSPLELALCGFLYAALWGDLESSQNCLGRVKNSSDPLVNFLIVLGHLSSGNQIGYEKTKSSLKRNVPEWMKHWLKLDSFARKKQHEQFYNESIDLLEKAALDSMYHWVYPAILNILGTSSINPKGLFSYVSENESRNSSLAYGKLLALVCGSVKSNTIDIVPYLSQFYARNGRAIAAIKGFDYVAKHSLLTYDQLTEWLGAALCFPQSVFGTAKRLDFLLNDSKYTCQTRLIILTYKYIQLWLDSNHIMALKVANELKELIMLPRHNGIKNSQIFALYIGRLLAELKYTAALYQPRDIQANLVCIGESHSLCPANTYFNWNKASIKCRSSFVMGVKMHHLKSEGAPSPGYQREGVFANIKAIEPNSHLLLIIGEIDCRPTEGIWPAFKAGKGALSDLVDNTVSDFVAFISEAVKDQNLLSTTLHGIPAPNYSLSPALNSKEQHQFLEMIKSINDKIRCEVNKCGWYFLDVYSATVNEKGMSNQEWHIDHNHLKPQFYQVADQYLIAPSNRLK